MGCIRMFVTVTCAEKKRIWNLRNWNAFTANHTSITTTLKSLHTFFQRLVSFSRRKIKNKYYSRHRWDSSWINYRIRCKQQTAGLTRTGCGKGHYLWAGVVWGWSWGVRTLCNAQWKHWWYSEWKYYHPLDFNCNTNNTVHTKSVHWASYFWTDWREIGVLYSFTIWWTGTMQEDEGTLYHLPASTIPECLGLKLIEWSITSYFHHLRNMWCDSLSMLFIMGSRRFVSQMPTFHYFLRRHLNWKRRSEEPFKRLWMVTTSWKTFTKSRNCMSLNFRSN